MLFQALSRSRLLQQHFVPSQTRLFSSTSSIMAKLNINSKLRMNSGYDIPILGYGVYQTPRDVCEEVTLHAFKTGYRHVDSAAAYTNEGPCGTAIKKSGLPRSEIFFTSKIPPKKLSYDNTNAQIEKSLQESGLDYIDLMLLHAPYGGPEARKGAWKALVEAQEAGKIRSLGVSNYGVHHLNETEQYIKELEKERGGAGKGGIISVNQCEVHPWCARPDIAEWCKQRGVIFEAYCPIVRGKKTEDELLKPLMDKYGKTGAQIMLRWSVQKGFVPLPKSVTPSRIEENANIWDFELSEEDMKSLETGKYEPCAWDPTVAGLEA